MFILRNLSYSIKNIRSTSAVRKAMKTHAINNPRCAYCKRDKKIQVHHKLPVSFRPDLAAEPNNLISLCAKRCHLVIGHCGWWKSYNRQVDEVCKVTELIKPND
jgi:hypothetical protein